MSKKLGDLLLQQKSDEKSSFEQKYNSLKSGIYYSINEEVKNLNRTISALGFGHSSKVRLVFTDRDGIDSTVVDDRIRKIDYSVYKDPEGQTHEESVSLIDEKAHAITELCKGMHPDDFGKVLMKIFDTEGGPFYIEKLPHHKDPIDPITFPDGRTMRL